MAQLSTELDLLGIHLLRSGYSETVAQRGEDVRPGGQIMAGYYVQNKQSMYIPYAF